MQAWSIVTSSDAEDDNLTGFSRKICVFERDLGFSSRSRVCEQELELPRGVAWVSGSRAGFGLLRGIFARDLPCR